MRLAVDVRREREAARRGGAREHAAVERRDADAAGRSRVALPVELCAHGPLPRVQQREQRVRGHKRHSPAAAHRRNVQLWQRLWLLLLWLLWLYLWWRWLWWWRALALGLGEAEARERELLHAERHRGLPEHLQQQRRLVEPKRLRARPCRRCRSSRNRSSSTTALLAVAVAVAHPRLARIAVAAVAVVAALAPVALAAAAAAAATAPAAGPARTTAAPAAACGGVHGAEARGEAAHAAAERGVVVRERAARGVAARLRRVLEDLPRERDVRRRREAVRGGRGAERARVRARGRVARVAVHERAVADRKLVAVKQHAPPAQLHPVQQRRVLLAHVPQRRLSCRVVCAGFMSCERCWVLGSLCGLCANGAGLVDREACVQLRNATACDGHIAVLSVCGADVTKRATAKDEQRAQTSQRCTRCR